MRRRSPQAWALALVACARLAAAARLRSSAAVTASGFAYDYSKHGTDWLAGLCGSRERQSPINFNTIDTPATGKIPYSYQIVKSSFEVSNNGHTFSADFAGLGYGGMSYEENWYNLMNVNVHALSEHTFKGVHYPLEFHFVHKKFDSEDLLIVAVPVTHTDHVISLVQWQQNQTLRKASASRGGLRGAPVVARSPDVAAQSYAGIASAALANAGLTEQALEQAGMAAAAESEQRFAAEQGQGVAVEQGQDASKPKVCIPFCAPTLPPGFTYPIAVEKDAVYPTEEPDHYDLPPEDEHNFNPTIQHFLRAPLPLVNEKTVMPVDELRPLDLNTMLEGAILMDYAGSMTAPPCAEAATWFVRRNPVKASETQVKLITDAIYMMTADFGNFRAVMPVNGRPIATVAAVKETAPPAPPEPEVPLGDIPRTDREFQAMKWARDALHLSKTSADYVHNLDQKLQRAAQAHVAALAPDLYPDYTTLPPGHPHIAEKPNVVDMSKTAAVMARAISGAAKEAIHDASRQIAEQAEQAAKDAAREAADMASIHMNLPTTPPPLDLPHIPAAAPAPGMAPAPAPPDVAHLMAPAGPTEE